MYSYGENQTNHNIIEFNPTIVYFPLKFRAQICQQFELWLWNYIYCMKVVKTQTRIWCLSRGNIESWNFTRKFYGGQSNLTAAVCMAVDSGDSVLKTLSLVASILAISIMICHDIYQDER